PTMLRCSLSRLQMRSPPKRPRWAAAIILSNSGRVFTAETFSENVVTISKPRRDASASRSGSWVSVVWAFVETRSEMAVFTKMKTAGDGSLSTVFDLALERLSLVVHVLGEDRHAILNADVHSSHHDRDRHPNAVGKKLLVGAHDASHSSIPAHVHAHSRSEVKE